MALPVAPPPTDPKKMDSQTLTNWFTNLRAPANSVAPPATSASPAIAGQIAFDQNFIYIAVGKNQWRRIPHTAF